MTIRPSPNITASVTIGRWGGFYVRKTTAIPGFRICVGFLALTFNVGEIPSHEAFQFGLLKAVQDPEKAKQLIEDCLPSRRKA